MFLPLCLLFVSITTAWLKRGFEALAWFVLLRDGVSDSKSVANAALSEIWHSDEWFLKSTKPLRWRSLPEWWLHGCMAAWLHGTSQAGQFRNGTGWKRLICVSSRGFSLLEYKGTFTRNITCIWPCAVKLAHLNNSSYRCEKFKASFHNMSKKTHCRFRFKAENSFFKWSRNWRKGLTFY